MGKLIAVFGTPGAGKTTTAIKLAYELCQKTKKSTIYISPDISVPAISMIFPRKKKIHLYSLGSVIDKSEIFPEDLLQNMVCPDKQDNLGFLGYKAGENAYTYALPTDEKAHELFLAAKKVADYVVVDCTREQHDILSEISLGYADYTAAIINPNLKSIAYFGSKPISDHTVKVMNITDNDVFLPTKEIAEHFGTIKFTLPYSRELKVQFFNGTLAEKLHDASYNRIIAEIVADILKETK